VHIQTLEIRHVQMNSLTSDPSTSTWQNTQHTQSLNVRSTASKFAATLISQPATLPSSAQPQLSMWTVAAEIQTDPATEKTQRKNVASKSRIQPPSIPPGTILQKDIHFSRSALTPTKMPTPNGGVGGGTDDMLEQMDSLQQVSSGKISLSLGQKMLEMVPEPRGDCFKL